MPVLFGGYAALVDRSKTGGQEAVVVDPGEERGERAGAATCPLCGSSKSRVFTEAARSTFFRCRSCGLTFRDPGSWPAPEAERSRYEQHRNSPDDPRYVSFLRRLLDPLAARLEGPQVGLDFGCGPAPVLSALLRDLGHEMHDYDPFFAPDAAVLTFSYDFITCCEVLEHMHRPAEDLGLLDRMLRPGGVLAVMTGMVDDERDFATWSYVRDATHVAFFHQSTMEWVASRFAWTIAATVGDVTLFEKPGRSLGSSV